MDEKNLDTAIYLFDQIRGALETLQLEAKRHNLDVTLGCMQLCDRGIATLKGEKEMRAASKVKKEEKEV